MSVNLRGEIFVNIFIEENLRLEIAVQFNFLTGKF